MQHNIKKIKEVLVPYTAEENAELSGGEDTVPPPLPPRRPPPAAASAEAPDAPPLPQRTPQTEAEGRAAMKAYKEAWEKANAEAANRPITSDNPAGDQEYPVLLTLASVSWYVHGHGVLPDVPLYRLESQPISGGNLNFAWRCGDRDDSSKSVFVKQAPDFIKCLGADYKLTNKRAEVEANVLRALRDISADNAPEVLVYDDYRCAMILEDLRDFRLLRDDLLRGVVEESVAASLGRFCAKVYNETREKQDAYFSEMLGKDDNGAMRAITRDYVFTKPFQEDETNREIDAASSLGFRVASARNDAGLLAAVAKARTAFDDAHDCLSHGDLHAGSVMVDGARDRLPSTRSSPAAAPRVWILLF